MSEEDAFVRAICEQPHDDTPRLVYADWLDENDQPGQAEFIRAQCQDPRTFLEFTNVAHRMFDPASLFLSRWVLTPGKLSLLKCAELLKETLPKPSPAGRSSFLFRRGFVDEVQLTAAQFLDGAAELFARHPITRVELTCAIIHPSGGNDTYYVGGLCRFPREYWPILDNLPSRAAARHAISVVCVMHGRQLAGLLPFEQPVQCD